MDINKWKSVAIDIDTYSIVKLLAEGKSLAKAKK